MGTNFQTINAAFATSTNSYAVSWNSGLGSILTISVLNGQPLSISLVFETADGQSYSYTLTCFENASSCSGLSANLSGKTAAFNNLSIPASTLGGNLATAALTLSGTLSWP